MSDGIILSPGDAALLEMSDLQLAAKCLRRGGAPEMAKVCEDADAKIRRLTAEDWQGMETAPRDGTPIMLFARAKNATAPVRLVGWYLAEFGWIEAAFSPNKPVGIIPQCWRELPAFPSASPVFNIPTEE